MSPVSWSIKDNFLLKLQKLKVVGIIAPRLGLLYFSKFFYLQKSLKNCFDRFNSMAFFIDSLESNKNEKLNKKFFVKII